MSSSRYYDQQAEEVRKSRTPARNKDHTQNYLKGKPVNPKNDYSLSPYTKGVRNNNFINPSYISNVVFYNDAERVPMSSKSSKSNTAKTPNKHNGFGAMDDYVKDSWLPTRRPPKSKEITGKVNENVYDRDDRSRKSGYSQSRGGRDKSASGRYRDGDGKSSRSSQRVYNDGKSSRSSQRVYDEDCRMCVDERGSQVDSRNRGYGGASGSGQDRDRNRTPRNDEYVRYMKEDDRTMNKNNDSRGNNMQRRSEPQSDYNNRQGGDYRSSRTQSNVNNDDKQSRYSRSQRSDIQSQQQMQQNNLRDTRTSSNVYREEDVNVRVTKTNTYEEKNFTKSKSQMINKRSSNNAAPCTPSRSSKSIDKLNNMICDICVNEYLAEQKRDREQQLRREDEALNNYMCKQTQLQVQEVERRRREQQLMFQKEQKEANDLHLAEKRRRQALLDAEDKAFVATNMFGEENRVDKTQRLQAAEQFRNDLQRQINDREKSRKLRIEMENRVDDYEGMKFGDFQDRYAAMKDRYIQSLKEQL